MNRIAGLLILLLALLSAEEKYKSPVSSSVKEGKNLYVPIRDHVNLSEEIRIQQNDQNSTRRGVRP